MNLFKIVTIGAAVTGLIVSAKKVSENFIEKFSYRLPVDKLKIQFKILETIIESTLEVDNYSDFSAKMENLYAKVSYQDVNGKTSNIATSLPNSQQYDVLSNATTTIKLPVMRINNTKLPKTIINLIQSAATGSGANIYVTVGGRINGVTFQTTQRAI